MIFFLQFDEEFGDFFLAILKRTQNLLAGLARFFALTFTQLKHRPDHHEFLNLVSF
jgi:hypothetical protein